MYKHTLSFSRPNFRNQSTSGPPHRHAAAAPPPPLPLPPPHPPPAARRTRARSARPTRAALRQAARRTHPLTRKHTCLPAKRSAQTARTRNHTNAHILSGTQPPVAACNVSGAATSLRKWCDITHAPALSLSRRHTHTHRALSLCMYVCARRLNARTPNHTQTNRPQRLPARPAATPPPPQRRRLPGSSPRLL